MFNIFTKNIKIEDAFEDFKNKDATFIDVRTDQEHGGGHIEGSAHIDISGPSFIEEVNVLDKNKKYIVYCMTGGRASRATSFMKKNGFKDVRNLKGGITAWQRKHLPIV